MSKPTQRHFLGGSLSNLQDHFARIPISPIFRGFVFHSCPFWENGWQPPGKPIALYCSRPNQPLRKEDTYCIPLGTQTPSSSSSPQRFLRRLAGRARRPAPDAFLGAILRELALVPNCPQPSRGLKAYYYLKQFDAPRCAKIPWLDEIPLAVGIGGVPTGVFAGLRVSFRPIGAGSWPSTVLWLSFCFAQPEDTLERHTATTPRSV